jgi:hypothetical protein
LLEAEPILSAGGRAMDQSSEIFVGIDVSKARNATAIAEGGRDGEVRYLGEVEAAEEGTRRLIKRMGDVLQSGLSAVGAHCLRGDRSRARDAVSRHCGGAALRVRPMRLKAR